MPNVTVKSVGVHNGFCDLVRFVTGDGREGSAKVKQAASFRHRFDGIGKDGAQMHVTFQDWGKDGRPDPFIVSVDGVSDEQSPGRADRFKDVSIMAQVALKAVADLQVAKVTTDSDYAYTAQGLLADAVQVFQGMMEEVYAAFSGTEKEK